MLFSSPIFLYLFLPATLALYALAPRSQRNLVLLVASLFFYAWGEVLYVFLLLGSIGINHAVGRAIEAAPTDRSRRAVLAVGIGANLATLGVFKYANFAAETIGAVWVRLGGVAPEPLGPVHLPLGISFFTFQALSYIIDVHRRTSPAQRRLRDVALYIALFPQLVAGPIVRYGHIALQLSSRVHSLALFRSGVQRFVQGLAKKMLIANPLGEVADGVFAVPGGDLTTGLAWLGPVCFAFQIYFDFSGYSDMAIGLGRMFGFRFLENFEHPYVSCSVREFWRRWHISLSTWFRDYLYLPLGGNRRGPARTAANLLTVFLLCGLWHGASWNFVVWGLFHGAFLVAERTRWGGVLGRAWRPVRHAYALAVVLVGWVIFRADDLGACGTHLAAMLGFANGGGEVHYAALYLNLQVELALAAGAVLSTPFARDLGLRWQERLRSEPGRSAAFAAWSLANLAFLVALGLASAMSIAADTFNPFIYFRF